ncbi:hypothetical protein BC828DRAFT_347787, partial [Blastocladiella britannica]
MAPVQPAQPVPVPAYYYGQDAGHTDGAPVFTPTWAEFNDFDRYVAAVDAAFGRRFGICKIVPPPEWTGSLPDIRPRLARAKIVEPIAQHFEGGGGVYRQNNAQLRRRYSAADF